MQQLSSDLWDVIISHIHCTRTLLRLRRVCKSLQTQIPRHLISGIPTNLERLLFFKPESRSICKIDVSEKEEDLECAISDDGKRFWVWVYSNPIRLTQYYPDQQDDAAVLQFRMTGNLNSVLWIQVSANGIICMLTTPLDPDSESIMFSAYRSIPDEPLELVTTSTIRRAAVMRKETLNEEHILSRESIQCVSWESRTFVVMIPIDREGIIALLEIVPGNQWKMWQLQCGPLSSRIGCISQTRHLIHIIPTRGGVVWAINLIAPNPCPVHMHSLPVIPKAKIWLRRKEAIIVEGKASSLHASENGNNFIVCSQNLQRVFHLTQNEIRPLEDRKLDINNISFIGNDSIVCFIKGSAEYRLYNLKTKSYVRSFQFDFIPYFSLMGNRCIWSVGPSMFVHLQIGADTTAT